MVIIIFPRNSLSHNFFIFVNHRLQCSIKFIAFSKPLQHMTCCQHIGCKHMWRCTVFALSVRKKNFSRFLASIFFLRFHNFETQNRAKRRNWVYYKYIIYGQTLGARNGDGVCHENLGNREGFHRVCLFDDSLSEYAPLIDWHLCLI